MAGLLEPCRCRATHRGRSVDAEALNAPLLAHLDSLRTEPRQVDCLIVPGYTPRFFASPSGALHPKAKQRVDHAARDLLQSVAPLAIVSGGAVHSDDNEAVLMRDALIAAGVMQSRIWIDPCARHTTTNLRNAARVMLALGLRDAYVVTSDATYASPVHWVAHRFVEQAYYLGYPRLSTFHWRCRRTLGYTVGDLTWVRPNHVRFLPSVRCLEESPRATREGDP